MVNCSNNSHKQPKTQVASKRHRQSKWLYKTPLDVFARYKRCQTQGDVNPMSLDIQTEYKEDIMKHYPSMNADYETIPSEDVQCENNRVIGDGDASPADACEPSDSEEPDKKEVDIQMDVIYNPIPKEQPGSSRLAVVDIGTELDLSKDIPDYCAFIADVLQCKQVYVAKYDDSKELCTVHLLCDTDDVGKTSMARLKARQQGTFQLMWEDDARDNGYIT